MVICHSMNAGSTLGGGDTQTVSYAKEFVQTFCTHRQWDAKT